MCIEPHLSLCLAHWDPLAVDVWLAARAGDYLRPGCYIGGWTDPVNRDTWLDVVRVLPVTWLPAALRVAGRHGQRGVFDLCRRQLVRVPAAVP